MTINEFADTFDEPWRNHIKDLWGAFTVAFFSMIFIYMLVTAAAAFTHNAIDPQSTFVVSAIGGILVTGSKKITSINKKAKKDK